ncbi:hypothetical protein [Helicobacter cetorum]|uniref:Uncharacterized protein n=1 Tax=Helicobacter cetorum (strain ATCC BAA-429 / MIT 00-7128) TaxID=182217 RepID=I0EMF0_HELC0|nr:hypothetical protein [Helicobacter cetorum]AFI04119.1 hypothetical protein HCW_04250 [Helicobacter cetorum MIT 00-7128]
MIIDLNTKPITLDFKRKEVFESIEFLLDYLYLTKHNTPLEPKAFLESVKEQYKTYYNDIDKDYQKNQQQAFLHLEQRAKEVRKEIDRLSRTFLKTGNSAYGKRMIELMEQEGL